MKNKRITQMDFADEELGITVFVEWRFDKYKLEIEGFTGSGADWDEISLDEIKGLVRLLGSVVDEIETGDIGKKLNMSTKKDK